MKVVFKKLLVSIILIVTIFNFIFESNISYAADNVTDGGVEEFINFVVSAMGGIVSIMYWPLRIKVTAGAFIINELVLKTLAEADGGDIGTLEIITPYHIFFNKIAITDINFFDIEDAGDTSKKFRLEVAEWYYSIRLIAVMALLVVLVYVGIRMAISTIAEDKAKYKKMLTDWVMSIALLFVMEYIILFIIEINNVLVVSLESAVKELNMDEAIGKMGLNALIGIGIGSITSTIVYAGLMIFTLGFLISYINRMLKIGFLILISPLITITYSIDKMKDNKSQALDTWFKEIAYTILIQPFHCVIYLAYISVCFDLINAPTTGGIGDIVGNATEYNQLANGVLAIFCILFIKQSEKIVRKIFGFKDDDEKTSMAAGLVKTAAVMSAIPKAGAAARTIQNKVGNLAIMSKVKSDFNLFTKNSKTLQKVTNKVTSTKAFSTLANNVSKAQMQLSKATKNAKKMINGVKKFADKRPQVFKSVQQKLTDYATNPENKNKKARRWMAAKTSNVVSSIRKANSGAGALKFGAAIAAGAANDGDIGKTMAVAHGVDQAVENYQDGGAKNTDSDLSESAEYGAEKDKMREAREEVGDREETEMQEKLTAAEADTQNAREEYKNAPPGEKKQKAKEKLVAATNRERVIRQALMSKQKYKKKQVREKADTYKRLHGIKQDGDKGNYKRGSSEERKKKSGVTDLYSRTIQNSVDRGELSQAEADEIKAKLDSEAVGLFAEIEARAGKDRTFNAEAVQALIDKHLGPTLQEIPAYVAAGSRIISEMLTYVNDYRMHCDESYMYNRLAKFEKNGGSIDQLVDQMYEDIESE